MAPDDLIEFLRSTEFLGDVPVEALPAIAERMSLERVAAGEVLFEEGSAGDAAYLIVEGQMALTTGRIELFRRGPGGIVGEFSLIDDEPRSASGVARTPLVVLRWRRDDFLETLAGDSEVARGILRVLTGKLRRDVEVGVGLLVERERWHQDLARSREIQVGMLPPQEIRLAGVDVCGRCTPAADVGGDFYDVVEFAPGEVGIVIGDVTGPGVYSGLFVAMAKSCLHTQARFSHSPAKVMESLRRALDLSLGRRLLMTCAYVLIDTAAGRLRYANAGHPGVLHLSAATGTVESLGAIDPILGALDVDESEYHFRRSRWNPGDMLVFYSDGITETRAPDGEEFGEQRLAARLRALARQPASAVRDALLEAVEAHGAGRPRRDDLTLVVAKATTDAPT